MKFSRYNFTITLNGSKYLYNSLSNTLITLDDDLQIIMKSLKNNSLQICNFKNKDLLKELIQLQVIVEDDNEEFMYLQYSSNLYRNDFEKIYLSIAPTQDCNFNCTYCYESDRPKIYMNEKIENQIIDYLRSVSPKLMTLVWFGGEPLMAIDTIESLSKKMSVLNIQIEESFIITNGFLLNLNIFKRLLKCGITDLQITLDGSEDEHNQRRPLANGGSTFNTIKNNLLIILDYCTRLNINMKFCIRVNIDQTNKEDFFEVQKIFANYSPNLVTVYPGLKKDHSCRDNTCMKNVEFSDFHLDVFRKTGLRLMDFYPNNVLTECFTRHLTSYLIGARRHV